MIAIDGRADARFDRVVDAFGSAFDGHPDMGAALAVRVDGQPVVDVWAGVADAATGAPWREDTVSVVFSCTKGLMSILAARAVERGDLRYADPVVGLWPEFGVGGKQGTTVADLLAHRAGLSAPRVDLSEDDIVDWARVTEVLAGQEPLWTPGDEYGYHAITHGWLIGEVLRRRTGRSVGDLFRDEVAGPLGADAWIGLPAAIEPRVAPMRIGASLTTATEEMLRPEGGRSWPARAMTLGGALPAALVGDGIGFNSPRVRAAEIPGAGGVASARALAAIWSATVTPTDGVRLLGDEVREAATVPVSAGRPFFEAAPPWPRWGMGFQLDSEARRYLSPDGFGHDGAGGQVAFADPGRRVGFSFVTNLMEAGDDRGTRIVAALADALA